MKLKKPNSAVLREMVRREVRKPDSLSNSYVANLIKQTIREVEDEAGLPPAVDAEINSETEPRPEQHPKIVKSVIVNRLKEAKEQIERVSSKVTNEMWRSAVDEAKEEVFPEGEIREAEEEAPEGGEEEQQGGKDVEKAVDKLESSAMAPLFKKISNADEFEGLFREFINLASQHPGIKKTAVKTILINFAKQVVKQDKGSEGEDTK